MPKTTRTHATSLLFLLSLLLCATAALAETPQQFHVDIAISYQGQSYQAQTIQQQNKTATLTWEKDGQAQAMQARITVGKLSQTDDQQTVALVDITTALVHPETGATLGKTETLQMHVLLGQEAMLSLGSDNTEDADNLKVHLTVSPAPAATLASRR